MSIRGLIEKWRTSLTESAWGASHDCAEELEAALPQWKRIEYESESTHPPMDKTVVFYSLMHNDQAVGEHSSSDPYWMQDESWTHWRPLCDLDYPPDQEL